MLVVAHVEITVSIEQTHRTAFNHQNIPGTNKKKLASSPWPTTLNPESKKLLLAWVVISAKKIKKIGQCHFP